MCCLTWRLQYWGPFPNPSSFSDAKSRECSFANTSTAATYTAVLSAGLSPGRWRSLNIRPWSTKPDKQHWCSNKINLWLENKWLCCKGIIFKCIRMSWLPLLVSNTQTYLHMVHQVELCSYYFNIWAEQEGLRDGESSREKGFLHLILPVHLHTKVQITAGGSETALKSYVTMLKTYWRAIRSNSN